MTTLHNNYWTICVYFVGIGLGWWIYQKWFVSSSSRTHSSLFIFSSSVSFVISISFFHSNSHSKQIKHVQKEQKRKTNTNNSNITAQSNGDGSVIVKGESCVLRRRTSVTQPSSTASEYRTERVTQVVLIRRRIRFYGFTTARHSILQATQVACSFIRHHHHL